MSLAKNRVIFTAIIVALILTAAIVAIFWARGFKPDFRTGRIERTGLITVSSTPTGASVYLDDRLTSATDTTIGYLEPKTYKIRIEKDGYTTWQKDIAVIADLATEIKALLFPTAPEIKPLTTTGAVNPSLSPDNSKIVYGVLGERGGLYLLPMSDRPFPFRQDTRLLAKNLAAGKQAQQGFDFTKAKFIWSPDSKEVIASLFEDNKNSANLLIDTDETDQQPRDITAALGATIASWQDEINAKAQTQALSAPDNVKEATASAPETSPSPRASPLNRAASNPAEGQLPVLDYHPTGLIFSPDEEKILYLDKNQKYKIYDLKTEREFTLPEFSDLLNIFWFPDSGHLLIAQKDQISIIETDGQNKMTVYSGKYENGFVFAHPSGTRLIILTTLAQQEGTAANLYSVNLR